MITKGNVSAEDVLALNELFLKEAGIEALRPEAKIIFSLRSKGPLSVKEAMILSGLSYRGFYIVMARLLQMNLISVDGDHEDRRVRKISLIPHPNPALAQKRRVGAQG